MSGDLPNDTQTISEGTKAAARAPSPGSSELAIAPSDHLKNKSLSCLNPWESNLDEMIVLEANTLAVITELT